MLAPESDVTYFVTPQTTALVPHPLAQDLRHKINYCPIMRGGSDFRSH